MLPEAHIAHTMPGRLRIRVPANKGDDAFFARVEPELRKISGVLDVRTNPLTGSILIHHRTTGADILAAAAERELFEEVTAPPEASILDLASRRVERLEHFLDRRAEGGINPFELVFGGLLVVAFIQLLRGQVFGPASALFSYAIAMLTFYRSRQTRP